MNKLLAGLALISTIVAALLAMQTETYSWVDADGPKLRMRVLGEGSPTVVFETGGVESLKLWGRVPLEVSRWTRTVSYDRAGNGLSDKSITLRDSRHIASELHLALRNANVAPPYLLVGHSVGGPYVRVFAGMYPNDVAGLVLVDPTQEETQTWGKKNGFGQPGHRECTSDDEGSCMETTLAQAHESLLPPNVPVILIHVMFPWARHPFPSKELDKIESTQKERVAVGLKFHQEWAAQVPGAKLIVTENSSHSGINFEEPELVIRAIREALERARTR